MSAWRAVGLNYVNYSNIAAKLLRQSLKPKMKLEAAKRDVSAIRFTKWEAGKPVKETK